MLPKHLGPIRCFQKVLSSIYSLIFFFFFFTLKTFICWGQGESWGSEELRKQRKGEFPRPAMCGSLCTGLPDFHDCPFGWTGVNTRAVPPDENADGMPRQGLKGLSSKLASQSVQPHPSRVPVRQPTAKPPRGGEITPEATCSISEELWSWARAPYRPRMHGNGAMRLF